MAAIRLKYLCSSFSTPLTQDTIKEEGLFPVYGASGLVGYADEFYCDRPYLGIIKDGAGVGRIGLYPEKSSLLGTMAYIVPASKVNISWLKYAIMSLELGRDISSTTIPHIYFKDYGNRFIHDITPAQQSRIAAFLDRRCAEIDRVIAATQRTIEEYKKLKQSIITEAVTHGVRGERKMKDSGVAWIGEIPEEWDVTKLKYFATIRSGITLGKVYPVGTKLVEYPYLRVANVQGSYTDLRDIAMISVTEEEANKYRLQDGELLMTEGGDRDKLGRGTVWHAEIDPCLHQNHVFALRTDSRLLAEFVSYLSDSFVGRDYFDVTANQSVHLASTNSTTILNFAIPFVPLEEQTEIVAYLDTKCSMIDGMIDAKQKLLSQLEAYKKAVIYEYVTGKKEVV